MSHKVSIRGVVKEYGAFRAVDDISLEIGEGELFTLLGPSGCGKTTLLRMIAGFNDIGAGEILFDEEVINHVPAHKRNIGMVFQNYAIFPHLTVKQNVAYGLKARSVKGAELEQRIKEGLELMQIEAYQDRSPSQLSGGQQQRVALARATVIHPGVLLMDEPLSNLDAKLRVQMRTSIKKMQRGLNITTIYVTHDQEEALAISDRIAVMQNGKVEQVGSPHEIYKCPASKFVASFIGTSGFLPGVANGDGVVIGEKKLPLRLRDGYTGEVQVAVRPEYITLREAQAGEICGEIAMTTFLGDFVNYEVQLEGGMILEANEYTKDTGVIRPIGQKVSLHLDLENISVFDSSQAGVLL